jgi:hypothetical protein
MRARLLSQDGVVNLVQKGVKKISPFFIPYAITNMGGALVAIDQVRGSAQPDEDVAKSAHGTPSQLTGLHGPQLLHLDSVCHRELRICSSG